MRLENFTIAVDRRDDGTVALTIHHGGFAQRLELSRDQAIATAVVMSGATVVAGDRAIITGLPSDDNRPDGLDAEAPPP